MITTLSGIRAKVCFVPSYKRVCLVVHQLCINMVVYGDGLTFEEQLEWTFKVLQVLSISQPLNFPELDVDNKFETKVSKTNFYYLCSQSLGDLPHLTDFINHHVDGSTAAAGGTCSLWNNWWDSYIN